MPQYKLTYFPVMGLGEPIRFILSYGGVDFEDIRLDFADWPKLKPTMPFGQMPVLEIDGKMYHQTLPICRYLAKRFNIAGKTDLDALEIEAIINSVHDLRKHFSIFHFEQDPELKIKKKEVTLKETVPYYLRKLDALVQKNNGYLHGGELTYADLFFVSLIDHMNGFVDYDIIKEYPNLQRLNETVLAIPSIKAWVQKRPKSVL